MGLGWGGGRPQRPIKDMDYGVTAIMDMRMVTQAGSNHTTWTGRGGSTEAFKMSRLMP
jgi:hypothetical protein